MRSIKSVSVESQQRSLRQRGEHKALRGYSRETKTDCGTHPAATPGELERFLERGLAAQRAVDAETARAVWAAYPADWRPCPGCGMPALDGKATCGDVACSWGHR
jgi:hypothetical protein